MCAELPRDPEPPQGRELGNCWRCTTNVLSSKEKGFARHRFMRPKLRNPGKSLQEDGVILSPSVHFSPLLFFFCLYGNVASLKGKRHIRSCKKGWIQIIRDSPPCYTCTTWVSRKPRTSAPSGCRILCTRNCVLRAGGTWAARPRAKGPPGRLLGGDAHREPGGEERT